MYLANLLVSNHDDHSSKHYSYRQPPAQCAKLKQWFAYLTAKEMIMKNKSSKKQGNGHNMLQESRAMSQTPTSNKSANRQTTHAEQQAPVFTIQRIYLKNSSFDAPSSPAVFQENLKTELDMQVQMSNSKLSEGVHEAVLKVTVNGKSADKIIFTIEVLQAGIFTIQNFEPDQLNAILGGTCPNLLFPYAREAISDLVSRATLPLLYLTPINFDAVYTQSIQKKKLEETTTVAQQ